jgi:hypothetical protein
MTSDDKEKGIRRDGDGLVEANRLVDILIDADVGCRESYRNRPSRMEAGPDDCLRFSQTVTMIHMRPFIGVL